MEFKFAPEPLFVHANLGLIDQILMNVTVNTRHAMAIGGHRIIETSRVEFDKHAAAQSGVCRPGLCDQIRNALRVAGFRLDHVQQTLNALQASFRLADDFGQQFRSQSKHFQRIQHGRRQGGSDLAVPVIRTDLMGHYIRHIDCCRDLLELKRPATSSARKAPPARSYQDHGYTYTAPHPPRETSRRAARNREEIASRRRHSCCTRLHRADSLSQGMPLIHSPLSPQEKAALHRRTMSRCRLACPPDIAASL